MSVKESDMPKISAASTKKEMLAAFNTMKEKLEAQARAGLQPEKVREERKRTEVVEVAEAVAAENIPERLNALKVEIGGELADIADKLEKETDRYNTIKKAIAEKDRELKEILEIEKSAFALAALLDSHKQRKQEFEEETAARKEFLEEQMSRTRAEWEKEQKQYAESLKERHKEDEKIRKRREEEYEYDFNRKKEQRINALNDDINQLEKELLIKREAFDIQTREKEKELKDRESAVSEREKVMDTLQARVDAFPGELDAAVRKAIQEVTDRFASEGAKNEALITKGFEGEKNVFRTRIESLEQVVADQKKQIENLSAQLEKAYNKVQDIAVKAVGSHGHAMVPSVPAAAPAEQNRK